MHVSGLLWECSATLKIFRPHLLMSSRSFKRVDNLIIHLSESHSVHVLSFVLLSI